MDVGTTSISEFAEEYCKRIYKIALESAINELIDQDREVFYGGGSGFAEKSRGTFGVSIRTLLKDYFKLKQPEWGETLVIENDPHFFQFAPCRERGFLILSDGIYLVPFKPGGARTWLYPLEVRFGHKVQVVNEDGEIVDYEPILVEDKLHCQHEYNEESCFLLI